MNKLECGFLNRVEGFNSKSMWSEITWWVLLLAYFVTNFTWGFDDVTQFSFPCSIFIFILDYWYQIWFNTFEKLVAGRKGEEIINLTNQLDSVFLSWMLEPNCVFFSETSLNLKLPSGKEVRLSFRTSCQRKVVFFFFLKKN